MPGPDLTVLVDRHASLSSDLENLLREAGEVRRELALRRRDTWHQTAGYPVTERREEVSAAVADLTADLHDLDAQVEAARVALAHATLRVDVAVKMGVGGSHGDP